MLQVFHLDVVKVDQVLHMFFRCFASVSDVCCNYFSCFRTYVASVLYGYCKSISSVAHVF
jgi:hypothetical protein